MLGASIERWRGQNRLQPVFDHVASGGVLICMDDKRLVEWVFAARLVAREEEPPTC